MGSNTLMLAAALLAGGVIGLAAHEATHYIACRLADAPARPVCYWDGYEPMVAIRTNVRAHTVRSYRLTCLAPLAVCLPTLAAVFLAVPTDTPLVTGVMMVAIATIPSPPDWKHAYYAPVLDDLHAGWFGDHPTHTAAEGIAA